MIESILLVLVAFALPIPIWLVILHSTLIKAKGTIRIATYFSLGIFWLVSFIIVFLNGNNILIKFDTNIFLKILAIIFLVLALIIDYFTVKFLGLNRLSCFVELKGKSQNQLVTKGIYKYARHPRYIEYVLLSLFIGFFFGYSFFLYLSMYLLIGFYIVTYFEEKELINRFGQSYIEYKKMVPRFFINIK